MTKQTSGIIVLTAIFLLLALSAEASIIRVPDEYKTISEAIDAAEPGAIIIVASGTYSENITITKPVFLRSSRGAKKTIITAADADKPTIHIKEAKNVTILAFTVKGSTLAGVLVEKNRDLKIILSNVTENENGVLILNTKKCSIYGNHFDSNNSYGLYLNKASSCVIKENSISRNNDKGLFLFSSHDNAILNNKMNMNKWNGMLIWSSNNNTIKNNHTLRNMFGYVTGESSDNDVSNNTSLPDLFLILPILLIYLGFIFYLIQMYIFKMIYGR
ncbi:MAG: nitrous oxide reductase family maturation protein NosD [Thermodesulfobacteriota bacterium]